MTNAILLTGKATQITFSWYLSDKYWAIHSKIVEVPFINIDGPEKVARLDASSYQVQIQMQKENKHRINLGPDSASDLS